MVYHKLFLKSLKFSINAILIVQEPILLIIIICLPSPLLLDIKLSATFCYFE